MARTRGWRWTTTTRAECTRATRYGYRRHNVSADLELEHPRMYMSSSGFLRPDFEKPDEKRPIQGAQGPNLTDHTIGRGQGTTKCQHIVYCGAENGVNEWLFEAKIQDFCGQSFGGASRGLYTGLWKGYT
ncbi:hypothetical protein DFH07DRAFT_777770 [Mycena maculata]|uniref:Uncharacterized protein n=1 Tax=Mycena maculata TaxID=230809 RepID=A0AAD7IG63_9AGAR|nr:hypothetical protein DFH07DRAFT_777770 [Mycena maculata]